MARTEEIRGLLARIRDGQSDAWDRLLDIVYGDLRRMARNHLRGRRTDTLGTTAMVNEAYLRLAGSGGPWQDRAHFFAVASTAMRQILVSSARRRLAKKRGEGARPVELEDHHLARSPRVIELIALDDALKKLAAGNERLARVVEMKFFGDLESKEIAEVMGVTDRTVRRDWEKARLLLYDLMS